MDRILRRKANHQNWQGAEIHPLLQRIYANRGLTSSQELNYHLNQLLPFNQLSHIQKAVLRLYQALKEGQHVMIVGDFDADGATSTALAVLALREFGISKVSYLVPNRFEYGYGLTSEIVEIAAKKQPDLIITVDNGISSIAGVSKANKLGIEVLVTDHHLAGKELPDAVAIVNPNLMSDRFLSKNLAGVGVVFYLMLALRSYLREKKWFQQKNIPVTNMSKFLDLVALGTVADVVKLDTNNRILVHQGLQRIRAGKCCPGLTALIEIAGRQQSSLTASDLGFAVAPRLNAAGRIEDMSLGIACLLVKDVNQARELASRLDILNQERKTIENKMQVQAFSILDHLNLHKDLPLGVCLFDDDWHQGVIGILASRIKERLNRPVIAFAPISHHYIKGSARSVSGVHVRDVLANIGVKYPALMTKFGGHAMAAGLTLPKMNYALFQRFFALEVAKYLTKDDLQNTIYSDGELTSDELTLPIAELLRDAGPWGQGFPQPVFDNQFKVLEQRIVGEQHLKLTLSLPDGKRTINAIHFNADLTKWPNLQCDTIHAAYRLGVNEYRGQCSLQLVVEGLVEV